MRFDPCAKSCHGAYMRMVPTDSHLPDVLTGWFATKGWTARRHQLEMLAAARAGRHALLVAPTGSGKTLAGFLPTLVELIDHLFSGEGGGSVLDNGTGPPPSRGNGSDGLHTLYISPLKALAVDVRRNLQIGRAHV